MDGCEHDRQRYLFYDDALHRPLREISSGVAVIPRLAHDLSGHSAVSGTIGATAMKWATRALRNELIDFWRKYPIESVMAGGPKDSLHY